MSERVCRVGFVGCGNISGSYVEGCRRHAILDVVACADLEAERARALALELDVPKACQVEELLADPDVDIVLNLTAHQAHAAVSLAAIEAGKHVYSEKPLASSTEEGLAILEAARGRGVRVGCAPDTFLGGGLQTCRRLIDEGLVGQPLACFASYVHRGHEWWHPDPESYYRRGCGPALDTGPYLVTALVSLLGPVARVAGSAMLNRPERVITSEPRRGARIQVEANTHVAGVLEFASGASATVMLSYDVWAAQLPRLEIYGTEGTLSVPHPEGFGGPVRIWLGEASDWSEVQLTHGAEAGRGIGVADMAHAIAEGREHRASGELALHVLDTLCALEQSSSAGQHVTLSTTCARPAPLPAGSEPSDLALVR